MSAVLLDYLSSNQDRTNGLLGQKDTSNEGEKNDAYLGNANGLRLLGQKDTAHASRPLVGTTISVDKFHST